MSLWLNFQLLSHFKFCLKSAGTDRNAFLPEFMADYNRRFAKEASNPNDAHRPTTQDGASLKRIFSYQQSRQLSKNLELSYNNVIYQIQTDKPGYNMRGSTVMVCERHNEITLLYKGKTLTYKTFDKNNRPTKILDSKQVAMPREKVPHKPAEGHPWRQYEQVKALREIKEGSGTQLTST